MTRVTNKSLFALIISTIPTALIRSFYFPILLFIIILFSQNSFAYLVIIDGDDANTNVSFNLSRYADNHCRFQWSINGSDWSSNDNIVIPVTSSIILDFRYEYDVDQSGSTVGYKNQNDFTSFSIGDLNFDGYYDDVYFGYTITGSESYYGPKYPLVHVEVTGQSGIRDRIVPIPSAAWLLGTGIVGMAALRRKAQK